MYIERGLKFPWDDEEQKPDEDPEHETIEEAVAEHVEAVAEAEEAKEEGKQPEYVPPPITARLDVTAAFDKKLAAVLVHRTQFAPEGTFRTMPEDIARIAFGEEHYSLVKSLVQTPEFEEDLLAGLD